jgi:hypothetical protein
MCEYLGKLTEVVTALMEAKNPFVAFDGRYTLRNFGVDCRYRECLYETLTLVQKTGAEHGYVAVSADVGAKNNVWLFVH